jgi:hypothetical protein
VLLINEVISFGIIRQVLGLQEIQHGIRAETLEAKPILHEIQINGENCSLQGIFLSFQSTEIVG